MHIRSAAKVVAAADSRGVRSSRPPPGAMGTSICASLSFIGKTPRCLARNSLASSNARPVTHEALWRGSHHQLAMRPVSDSPILGNFNHASFNNNNVTSTFFRSGLKFMVLDRRPGRRFMITKSSTRSAFIRCGCDLAKALTYAQRLDELEPGSPQVRGMLKELNEHLRG